MLKWYIIKDEEGMWSAVVARQPADAIRLIYGDLDPSEHADILAVTREATEDELSILGRPMTAGQGPTRDVCRILGIPDEGASHRRCYTCGGHELDDLDYSRLDGGGICAACRYRERHPVPRGGYVKRTCPLVVEPGDLPTAEDMNRLAALAWEMAHHNGFRDKPPTPDSTVRGLALVVTEVSEAIEEIRRSGLDRSRFWYLTPQPDGKPPKPEGLLSELADVKIRIDDICADLGMDIGTAVHEKMAYNRIRGTRYVEGKRF